MKSFRSFNFLAAIAAGFFICFILLLPEPTLAYDQITTDTVWRLSDSPIIVSNGFYIKPGVKLTIEPGVIIKFAAADPYDRTMVIQGSLEALGTAEQPIIFTSIHDDSVGGDSNSNGSLTAPKAGDWLKLSFESYSHSVLNNVIVRYGGYGGCNVVDNYRGNLEITDSTIAENRSAISNNEGDLLIVNSSIFHNSWSNFETGIQNYGRSGYIKTVVAQNNWWGTDGGPCAWRELVDPSIPPWQIDFPSLCGSRPLIDDLVIYDPWLLQPPEPEDNRLNPVIVIPGLMGSWQNWQGEWEIDPILHTYDDLLDAMRLAGYHDGETLFTFPYQWRQSNVITAEQLRAKINEVKIACSGEEIDCKRVDLVAHSMGGLIARAYIEGDNYQNDVDQLIFIATPHKGAPKAYLMWEGGEMEPKPEERLTELLLKNEAKENGYSGDGALMNYIKETAIDSVRQLLPIYHYLFDYNDGNSSFRYYPNNYPRNEFLENLNSSENLDKLKNVRLLNILGDTGLETLNALYLVDSTKPNLWADGMPYNFYDNKSGLFYGEGDSTVPKISNSGFVGLNNLVIDKDHRKIVAHAQKEVIKELTGQEPTTEIYTFYFPDILLLAMHSPADFMITAPDGQRIGRDLISSNPAVINEIPGAFYSGFNLAGQAEFVVIPNPLAGDYQVTALGVDNGGAYSVSADFISETTSTQVVYEGQIMPNQSRQITFGLADGDSFTPIETDISLDSAIADVNELYDRGLLLKQGNKQKIIQQYKLLELKMKVYDKLIGLAVSGLEKLNSNPYLKAEIKSKLAALADQELAKLRLKRAGEISEIFRYLDEYLNTLAGKDLLKPLGYGIIKANNDYLINNL